MKTINSNQAERSYNKHIFVYRTGLGLMVLLLSCALLLVYIQKSKSNSVGNASSIVIVGGIYSVPQDNPFRSPAHYLVVLDVKQGRISDSYYVEYKYLEDDGTIGSQVFYDIQESFMSMAKYTGNLFEEVY